MKLVRLSRSELKLYLGLVAAGLLYVLPILLADRYYYDDLARALYGATGWIGDGRPLGEGIILALCEGYPVIDISPLPLIMSVLLLSYSLVLYGKTNLSRYMNSFMQFIVLLLVIVNPFAITNFSYHFDCIIMFMALSLNFFIYAMPTDTNRAVLFSASIIVGILIMSSYQAAIGMVLVLFVINILWILLDSNGSIKAEFVRIAGVVSGAVLYKLVIAEHLVSQEDWRYKASQTVSGLNWSSIKTILVNIWGASAYIVRYYMERSKVYSFLHLIMIIVAVFWGITICFRKIKYSGIKKIVFLCLFTVSPAVIFLLTFLPLMILENLTIKGRIFIAFGGFMLFVGILLCYFVPWKKIVCILLLTSIFYQYTYVYAYGNALASQKEYEKYMAYSIVHDIESINYDGAYKTISFVGKMPRSRQLQLMCEKYPYFVEYVPIYFGNSTWIEGAWPSYYMQEDLYIAESTEEDQNVLISNIPIKDNSIYSCYVEGEKIIVSFK